MPMLPSSSRARPRRRASRRALGVVVICIAGGLGGACASAPATATVITSESLAPTLGLDLATFTRTPDGLYFKDVVVGTGTEADQNSRVTVAYRALLANGTPVDSSGGLTFRLRGNEPVIRGWRLGIPGMKVGGARLLVVPPELGYKWRQAGAIPPNSVLVFRIQLLGVG